MSDLTELARRYYKAYEDDDRQAMEAMLAPDFTFTSPYDDAISREAFFARCWPNHVWLDKFDLELVLAEANAAGVPVIAMDLGSCREVIEHGVTGFLVSDVAGAVKALEEVPAIADDSCTRRVRERFSVATMVEGYERVYARIFLLESEKPA